MTDTEQLRGQVVYADFEAGKITEADARAALLALGADPEEIEEGLMLAKGGSDVIGVEDEEPA